MTDAELAALGLPPVAVLRASLAAIPGVAIFLYDATSTHRFCGGDPKLLADLNLPADGVEGLPVGYSLANASTWGAAADAALRCVRDRAASVIRVRMLDRHYVVHVVPMPDGWGVNVIVDVTPRSLQPS